MRFPFHLSSILLLLFIVSSVSAQTPLWMYASPHQSTTDRVADLAISRNGATIAVAGSNLIILNRSGAELGTYFPANTVAMSTDGARIAAAMNDGLSVISSNGTLRWSRGTEPLTQVTVSGDGSTIASGDRWGALQIYNVTGTRIGSAAIIWKQPTAILELAASRNGSVIAATSSDGLHLYTKKGKVLWKIGFERPSALSLAANGTMVAVGGPNSVRLYNATNTSGELLGTYATGGKVDSLATSSDGMRTVVGTEDDRITLLNETGDVLWSRSTEDWVNQVALSENASVIAAGSMDRNLKVLASNGTLLWDYDLETRPTALAVSGDGRYIGVGCEDGTAYLFSTAPTQNRTVSVKKKTSIPKNQTGSALNQSISEKRASSMMNQTANNSSSGLQPEGTILPDLMKSPAPGAALVLAVLGLAMAIHRRRS